jgi:hypothetical protein
MKLPVIQNQVQSQRVQDQTTQRANDAIIYPLNNLLQFIAGCLVYSANVLTATFDNLVVNLTAKVATLKATNATIATLTATSETVGTLTVTGNETVGGTLGVTGATTLSSTLGVTGATTLSNTLGVTGAATLSNTTNIVGPLNVGWNGTTDSGSSSAYAYFLGNNSGTNPVFPKAQGLALTWNRSGGNGESNIIWETQTGGSPYLEFGTWNGTTYTKQMFLTNAGALTTTAGITSTTLNTSGLATLNSASITNSATVGTTLGVTGTTTLSGTANVVGPLNVGWNGSATTSGAGAYTYHVGNANGTNPAFPATQGLALTWNRSAGSGESNIIWDTQTGTAPKLEFGSWNGTTYVKQASLDTTGLLTTTGGMSATTLTSSGAATLNSASVTTTLAVTGTTTLTGALSANGGISAGSRFLALRGAISSASLTTNGTYIAQNYYPGAVNGFTSAYFVPAYSGSIAAITAKVYTVVATAGTVTLSTSGATSNPSVSSIGFASINSVYTTTFTAGTYTFTAGQQIIVQIATTGWAQAGAGVTAGVELEMWVYA